MWRSLFRTFASAPSTTNNKAVVTQAKKGKSKSDAKSDTSSSSAVSAAANEFDDKDVRARRLAEDESDRSLDVGPNGRPLFTSTPSLSQLSRTDTCTYMKFSMEELNVVLPEGLPLGMVKEFEESKRTALLIQRFETKLFWMVLLVEAKVLHLQCLFNGPEMKVGLLSMSQKSTNWFLGHACSSSKCSSGKNVVLPAARAAELKLLLNTKYDFLKYLESRLQQLPCQISDPILLGEGAGVGWMKGVDSMEMLEGSTLYDLIQTGVTHTHSAVGVLVCLRKELSLVKDIPILLAIDQYNNWFTFSGCEEPVTVRSCRPVHARELAMVNAFRSMMHNDMMVGAFSHSAVGKLRKDLPDVPADARVNFAHYNLDEAAAVCHHYLRQRLIRRESFSEEGWKKIFYLSNGNGSEMIIQGAMYLDSRQQS
ncbi:hypothetical protein RHSIM_Rhsim06G0112000 [Rhododendron simsii]|uniref:Small ribosomal subunit protein mS29 n=1 Tax=Rhododendron simsii TaxID=118357 RepID=A0A834GVZ5_RHOSS|nr:hypothetical protein RHSIM_Rhsim06G0112000 [Rhododendron simsii]